MRRGWTVSLLVLLAAALGGCDAMPIEPASAAWDAAPTIDALDADFAAGASILSGFDPPLADDDGWNERLQLLLGVKLERGRSSRVWFIRLVTTAHDAPEAVAAAAAENGQSHAHNSISIGRSRLDYLSPLRPVRVDLYDHDGTRLGTSVARVPAAYLQYGLLHTCEAYRMLATSGEAMPNLDTIAASEELPAFVHAELGSWLALVSLTQLMGSLPALQPLTEMAQRVVVRSPGLALLPALATGNLHVGLDADFEQATAVQEPWSDDATLGPLYHLPLTASVSGHRLVNARLLVGSADPPYLLSGGILYLEAVHPTRPNNRLTARVLAARRR